VRVVQSPALGRWVTLQKASRWELETSRAGVLLEGDAAEAGRMAKALVSADEQGGILSIWRKALGIIRRYPLASVFPAAVLSMLGAAPYYLIKGQINLPEEIVTSLTGAFAFYLYIIYIAYAEEVTAEAERGVERITTRGVLHMLRQASPVVPPAMVAAVAAIIIPRVATVVLVIPGLWILTRWSLFAPVISRERLGPVAALKRSNELVRGHFELVFLTAASATVLEEVAVHAGGAAGLLVSGSDTWGQWLGGSLATLLTMPLAAFATSVAYVNLTAHTRYA
jgi:hypothetical protein